jgi:hypothetical protein
MTTYCQNQRNATRLICTVCHKPYDVTHAERLAVFTCVWCARNAAIVRHKPAIVDISGNVMTDP